MTNLSASDITGIVVGAVSGLLTSIGLIITFCAWKYPRTPAGRLGARIGKQLSLKGGHARGGDATGTVASGGCARGGDIFTGREGCHDNETTVRSEWQNSGDGFNRTNSGFWGGDARGGDAVGSSNAIGGSASGGGVSFV
ncbi:hypothetical protein MGN70_003049 [Eutypa lata]|nr:hypothetical protein MGN70_003049 [Eutypa lata]